MRNASTARYQERTSARPSGVYNEPFKPPNVAFKVIDGTPGSEDVIDQTPERLR